VSFAQFVMLQPFPGTLDFATWEKGDAAATSVGTIPLARYWLIPSANRPKIYSPHPAMSADEIRQRTQATWDEFYRLPHIWKRSSGCVTSLKARIAFVLISKLYRQMYANTGIATDSARVARSARRARVLAKVARRFFVGKPMPDLQIPASIPARPRSLVSA
jgi:hypothetical protein